MEVLYPRCAGLDVHADSVTACLRLASGDEVTYQHRTVSTTTRGLLDLADWLIAAECTHVAMEATGVYWKPVWHVLEGPFTIVLANAMHIRNVPGRKSDTNDATWIVDLLAHGLIRSKQLRPPRADPRAPRSILHLLVTDRDLPGLPGAQRRACLEEYGSLHRPRIALIAEQPPSEIAVIMSEMISGQLIF